MPFVPVRSSARVLARAAFLLIATASAALAQGTISGRVTAAGSGEPIQDARVVIVGTSAITTTNPDGRYTLRNAPTGSVEVRVVRVGFAELKKAAAVSAGQTLALDFALTPVVVKLTEIVTTATGDQRRIELGNSISQINAADISKTETIRSISDLMTARAPGVQVLPNTMTGGGSRIRIRGTNSLSLNNDPIYVIDGIRMSSANGSMGIGVGGTTLSRVNDINPQDIENIEIVKGPSAATLYGTDAANGVVVITTKRGRAGATRYNTFVENGIIRDQNPYPTAFTMFGTTTAGTKRQCFLNELANGICTQDSLLSYNLWKDADATPLGTGQRQQYGLSASGGSDALSYFVSGDYEKELGVYTIPGFDRRRLDSTGVSIRQEWLRPNALEKQNFRINLTSPLNSKLDLQTSAGFIHLNQRLPQIDNNTTGLGSSAFGGPGYKTNGNGSLGFPRNGYRAFTPGDIFQETVNQQINRFIGSFNANYRPYSWMANRANVGVDYASRTDSDLCRRANCSDFGTNRLGFATNSRANIRNFSADFASSATLNPTATLNSKTTIGAQYVNSTQDQNLANASVLPPGTSTVTAGAVPFVSEATAFTKTLGLFAEEALAFRDRLFLTAAVRTDQNSAFGTNFQQVYYPKLSGSYIISDESFFPTVPGLTQLRIRSTYGAAGTQPGPNDATRFFQATTVNIDKVDVPGVVSPNTTGVGNANLKPERASEFEGGLDAKLFDSRVNLELTYYSKTTKDALISRVLPPSAGVATSRFENLGAVKNAGFEALLNTQLVSNRLLGWDATFSASSNANKIVDLGPVPPIIGSPQAVMSQKAGYPINGYWQRPILGFSDLNGDGIISYVPGCATAKNCEVVVGDTAVFLGASVPKYEMTLNNGFDLFNRSIRISSLFDYKGGFKNDNDTQRIRCQNRLNCQEEADKSSPLELQARVVALRDDPSRTQAGFIEDAHFVRFRELSVTYSAPTNIAARYFRSTGASLTFAARNLHVWTNYTGVDPESSYGTDAQNDFQTASPPTYYTLRLNFSF
ncbi:MAG: SusC/RagA family TonB-linked outer membrane protein [bacterium]